MIDINGDLNATISSFSPCRHPIQLLMAITMEKYVLWIIYMQSGFLND